MDTQQTVALRIRQLCDEHGFTVNGISNHSGVSQSTVKSIMNGESKNPGITTIKKLCTHSPQRAIHIVSLHFGKIKC